MLRFHDITSSRFSLTTRNVAFAMSSLCLIDTSLFIYQNAAIDSNVYFIVVVVVATTLWFNKEYALCAIQSYWFRFYLFFDGLDLTLLCAELLNRTANGLSFDGSVHSSHMDIVAHYAPNNFTVLISDERKRKKVDWNWCLSWRMSIEFLSSRWQIPKFAWIQIKKMATNSEHHRFLVEKIAQLKSESDKMLLVAGIDQQRYECTTYIDWNFRYKYFLAIFVSYLEWKSIGSFWLP